jgi:hypothetical protein
MESLQDISDGDASSVFRSSPPGVFAVLVDQEPQFRDSRDGGRFPPKRFRDGFSFIVVLFVFVLARLLPRSNMGRSQAVRAVCVVDLPDMSCGITLLPRDARYGFWTSSTRCRAT